MSRNVSWDRSFKFKGSACEAGTMICFACKKEISNREHDWTFAKYKAKDYDWAYRSHHRSCFYDDSGWLKVINEKALFNKNVEAIIKELDKFKSAKGEYADEFIEALDRIGFR